MEQYIKKSALLAEIDKRIRACGNCYVLDELASLYSSINNLETKEVDLEKSLTSFMSKYAYENGGEYPSAIDIAKHFFELGMAVSNKTQERE